MQIKPVETIFDPTFQCFDKYNDFIFFLNMIIVFQLHGNHCAKSYTSLGIITSSAKYPHYGSYTTRLLTYNQMSAAIPQSRESLARAGLFFTGTGDLVRCFYCGGGLRNWDKFDDPWKEHKRWFPKCDFLKIYSNHEASEEETKKSSDQISFQLPLYINRNLQGNNNSSVTPDIENLDYIIATKAVLCLGYSRDDVNRAFQICNKDSKTHVTARQILCKILELNQIKEQEKCEFEDDNGNSITSEDRDLYNEIESEYITLKQKLNCKLCEESPVEVAFLPCGHLATCSDCAPAMKSCLICKVVVKATVKVFMP